MPPKTAASKAVSSGGGGTTWWKLPELTILFQSIEKVLPLGEYQWIHVAEQYNNARPQGAVERSWESCRNKFKDLKNKKKPTGDATCPWEVKEAKRLQQEIEAKMCTAALDDANGNGGEEAEQEGEQESESSSSSSSDGDGDEGGDADDDAVVGGSGAGAADSSGGGGQYRTGCR